MLFSRKTILTKGKKPLYAASRVINASSASASSVVARCWVHGTNKTSAILRSVKGVGFRRAYSSRSGGSESGGASGGNGALKTGTIVSTGLPLYRKLINAWTETPTKWYPLPIAVGALLLVALQYRKKQRASKEVHVDENGMEIIKLKGPWQVHVLGALPLRNMSRLWGYINSLELPVWLRPYGFRLYAYAFGCNLDEIEPSDLKSYVSLGDFFYRKLKDGVRPVDEAVLVSPADGTVLHFGTITDLRVEQVKGITYSLDALLGVERTDSSSSVSSTPTLVHPPPLNSDMEVLDHHEFANLNGIEYSLEQLIGTSSPGTPGSQTPSSGTSTPTDQSAEGRRGPLTVGRQASPDTSDDESDVPSPDAPPKKFGAQIDASVVEPERNLQETLVHDATVARDMGVRVPNVDAAGGSSGSSTRPSTPDRKRSTSGTSVRPGNALFFAVIYLAPGDYHRFHSPTAWVVEKRRHFVGELFSVSPYMAKRLENLFVLNERVALLGRWKHGFFSMVPVGATNVGSIILNFDRALRTNVRGKPPPPGTYTEAVYSAASPILNGQPLLKAQEMGGFCLGSTVVLVFEAPEGFEFTVHAGQRVKVGQGMGDVRPRGSSAGEADGEVLTEKSEVLSSSSPSSLFGALGGKGKGKGKLD